jgi:hypothetical protein
MDAIYCSQVLVVNTRASEVVDRAATSTGVAKRHSLTSTESQRKAGLSEATLTHPQEVAAIALVGGW